MNVEDYRKEIEAKLAAESAAPRRPGFVSRLFSSLTGARGRETRKALDPATSAGNIERQIATLRDPAVEPSARQEALDALGVARFMGPQFAPYQEQYRDALREVATDPDEELRRRALEVLALEADPVARDLLVKSLSGPDEDLISNAKAIQLLGHDAHGDDAPLVRELMDTQDFDDATIAEGLRLIASDPGSADKFKELLRDKKERRFVRKLSAKGLQVVDPRSFETIGREIVADGEEDDDLRAAILAALSHAGDHEAARADPAFVALIGELVEKTSSENLREAARQFLKAAGVAEEGPLASGG